jgi:hypothetical protein
MDASHGQMDHHAAGNQPKDLLTATTAREFVTPKIG